MSLRVNMGRWLQNEYVNMTGQELEVRRAALTEYILAIENGQSSLIKNKYTGTRTKISDGTTSTQESTSNALIFNESREYSGYLYQIALNNEAPPNYDYKLNYDSLTNLQSVFSGYGNIRVYTASGTYTTKTLAQLLELYGDYLLFDYAKFSETPNNISKYGPISAYLNDSVITDNDPIAIRFSYNDGTIALPFVYKGQNTTAITTGLSGTYYWVTPQLYMYRDNGGQYIVPTAYTSNFRSRILDFYAAELLNAEGATIDYDESDVYTLRGTKIIHCMNTSGNKPFFLISKDVLDAFILDFYEETGIMLEYTGNIPGPSPESSGPRINELVIQNGTIFPPFNKDFNGPYTVTTDNETVVFEWTNNSLVDKNYVNLEQVIGNLYTFRSLEVGYTQANLTVENETSGEYFDYEIQIKKTGEYYNDPWISKIWVKDASSGVIYKPFPEETKDIKFYLVDIGLNSSQLKGKFWLDTASTYDLANITVEIKINDTLGWQNYNPGAEVNIPITESPHSIFLKLTSAITQNEITYEICFQRRETDSVNTNPGQGDDIPGSNGITSGTGDVADLTADYPPGFYGGSYIPTWRYTKPIFTTANGNYDFELEYSGRKSANDNAVATLNSIINTYTVAGKLEAICEAFIHYANFINDDSGNINWRYVLPAINVSILRPLTLTKDNITPKNKKCYIYPFCELELNGYGTNSELPYEEFQHTFSSGKQILEFDIFCKWFAGASIQVVPVNFQQVEDNFDYAVAGPEMPVFPFTKDQYLNEYNASRNTRAQALQATRESSKLDKISTVINGVIGVGNSVIGGAMASQKEGIGGKLGVAGAALSAAGAIGNAIIGVKKINLQINQQKAAMAAELADTANRPATVTNQNASPSLPMVIKDAACPFIIHKAIRPEFLKKVDKFFTRFGYRTNRTGVPNIYKRPNFAYLECKNAVIGGNIPAEDKQALKAIMEHGITFWHYGSSNFAGVGEYKDADLTYNAPTYS